MINFVPQYYPVYFVPFSFFGEMWSSHSATHGGHAYTYFSGFYLGDRPVTRAATPVHPPPTVNNEPWHKLISLIGSANSILSQVCNCAIVPPFSDRSSRFVVARIEGRAISARPIILRLSSFIVIYLRQ